MERRSWRAHTRGAAGEEEEMKRGGVGWGGGGAGLSQEDAGAALDGCRVRTGTTV